MKPQLSATYNVALKTAIVAARLTQRAVARRARIGETRFTRIVSGEYEPTEKERARLAKILGRSESDLFPAVSA
jgi:transcriptional regulator with XRE-family HTH domain